MSFRSTGTMLRRSVWLCSALLTLMLSLWVSVPSAAAQVVPGGFTRQLVATGLGNVTAMQFAPDGRLFVATQGGQLRVIKNGVLLPTPFLTVTTTTAGERGLLGLAFDPNFASNGFIYLYYTVPAVPNNRVSRFTADPLNADVALVGSELPILNLDPLGADFHNGGAMHFGPDGMLYIATGDNTRYTNPADPAAQEMNLLLGKVLRINTSGGAPSDNPFVGVPGARPEIWALGFRNPFTFAFQPGTGLMFINDVGEFVWEEINQGTAGANYGWPYYENTDPGPLSASMPPGFTSQSPRFFYDHATLGFSCAVTGGTFYSNVGYQYPADYVGDYFYGDFCGGWIQRYDTSTGTVTPFASALNFGLVDLKVSPAGEVFYLTRDGGGTVYRFTYSGPPEIIQHPAAASATEGGSATFTCAATGTAPLTYQWERNGAAIPGATSTSYTLNPSALADNGAAFRCMVTNAVASVPSNPATLTVTSAQQPAISVFDPALSKVGFLEAGGIGLPGEQITWVTTVTNNGGVAGTNVVVVDNVRSELRIDSVETDRGTATVNGQTVTVTIPTLAPGESVQFRIVTTVNLIVVSGTITNTVTISGTNESATASINVATVSRLPSTGETPYWRTLIVSGGLFLALGLAALFIANLLITLLVPRNPVVRRPIRRY